MRWALVSHPNQVDVDGELLQTPMHVPESSVPVALSQGWFVIAQDTGLYDDRDLLTALIPVDVPVQSNPRRHADDEDGA